MITYEKHHSSSVNYTYRQYDTNLVFGSHFHDSYELIYVFEGEIQVNIEKATHVVKKGEALLILPNQIHSYLTNDYSKTFIFIFASSFVQKFYKTSLKFESVNPIINDAEAYRITKVLMDSNDQYLLKSVLYYVVYVYLQEEITPRDEKYNTLMQSILRYIEENYQLDISLKSLSEKLGYDYHYISNIINGGLNTNFLSFLNEYRINKVCEMMIEDPVSSISDLAYQCGYNSLRTFNRNFIEVKKMTPSEYRQKLITE